MRWALAHALPLKWTIKGDTQIGGGPHKWTGADQIHSASVTVQSQYQNRFKLSNLYRSSGRMQYFYCCCVRKLCWVFPAVMPHYTSNASDTGFSISRPGVCLPLVAGFPQHSFLQSCECQLLLVKSLHNCLSNPAKIQRVRQTNRKNNELRGSQKSFCLTGFAFWSYSGSGQVSQMRTIGNNWRSLIDPLPFPLRLPVVILFRF